MFLPDDYYCDTVLNELLISRVSNKHLVQLDAEWLNVGPLPNTAITSTLTITQTNSTKASLGFLKIKNPCKGI